MAVLTLTGKPINWRKPPKATAMVMWSHRAASGKKVTGSLRTIAALDHLNELSVKRFHQPIVVIQPPFNTDVAKSAGTHDKDAVLDGWINGVGGVTQQSFLRANGAGAFYRYPPLFGTHEHFFILPPVNGVNVSKRWRNGGFVVGYLVDGGWSSRGRVVSSSQIADYYAKPPRNALAGHQVDHTWHPADIDKTVFNLAAYIKKQQAKIPPAPKPKPPAKQYTKKAPKRRVYHNNKHIKTSGGTVADSAAGTQAAKAGHFPWMDCNGHASKDVYPFNMHGFPFNPEWLGNNKLESYNSAWIIKNHPALRTARQTFQQNAAAGVNTEWEVKDIHPLASQANLALYFQRLAADAERAYGVHWKQHVEVKCLTSLGGGIAYCKAVLKAAHEAGFTTIVLPRGKYVTIRINEPYITYNRGGRV